MPRPTGRGYALLVLTIGDCFAARLLGTWELYFVAFAFAGFIVLSWLQVAVAGRKIAVKRDIVPGRPTAGDKPKLILQVQNQSLLRSPLLRFHHRLSPFSSEDIEIEMGALRPHEQKNLEISIGPVHRGVHLLPPALAICEDTLGLVKVSRNTGVPLPVIVYPRLSFLTSCALFRESGLQGDGGVAHSLPPQGISEFRGIRPLQPGEPLSHIDWKSTAKTGMLMIREMEGPTGSEVTIVVDGTAQTVVGEKPASNFEAAVQAAGSIADFALRGGRRVNLLLHESSWQRVPLAAGRSTRVKLLEALAAAQPTGTIPLAQALAQVQGETARRPQSQDVTIVGLSLDRELVAALTTLRNIGTHPTLVLIAGGTFTQPDSQSTLPAADKALLLALASAGIPSFVLDRDTDLAQRLSVAEPLGSLRQIPTPISL